MYYNTISVVQGMQWVHVHPPRAEKKSWGQIYRRKLYVHPQAESAPPEAKQECIFLGNWGDLAGGRGYLSSLGMCFEGDD